MSEKSQDTDGKRQFANLTTANKWVFYSSLLFLVSLLFAWTRSKYGLIITTQGYGYLEFYISRSGWPNLIPLSFLAAVANIFLSLPFMKPQSNERQKSLQLLATIQLVLSALGLMAMLILWLIQLPSFDGMFMFGAWLGLLALVGMVYGSLKTRLDLK